MTNQHNPIKSVWNEDKGEWVNIIYDPEQEKRSSYLFFAAFGIPTILLVGCFAVGFILQASQGCV